MSAIIEIVSCPLSLRKSQIIGDCLQPPESKKAIKDTISWSKEGRRYNCQRPYKRIPFVPLKQSLLASLTAMRIEPISVNTANSLGVPLRHRLGRRVLPSALIEIVPSSARKVLRQAKSRGQATVLENLG